jgi:cytochrome bd-type quinol oxidase subunit 1
VFRSEGRLPSNFQPISELHAVVVSVICSIWAVTGAFAYYLSKTPSHQGHARAMEGTVAVVYSD